MNVTALDCSSVWNRTPGFRTLVVDGGAVRFECPASWVVAPSLRYVCVTDRDPPQDRVLLAVSWRRIPLQASSLSLAYLLEDLISSGNRTILDRGVVHRIFKPPLDLAWVELRFVDPIREREASTRLCLARSGCTQVLAAFDFRPGDGRGLFGVWETFLRTLAVGETISDAVAGLRRERWG